MNKKASHRAELPSEDGAFKAMFTSPYLTRDLLLDFAGEYPFLSHIDFNTLEKHPSEYTTDSFKRRIGDMVWKARMLDGQWCWIFVMLEFQSEPDHWMAVRIGAYTCLLYQELTDSKTVKPGEPLPPVFPVVLYTGSTHWHAPTSMESLVYHVDDADLKRHQLRQEYTLIDVCALPDNILDRAKGLCAPMFRLRKIGTEDAIQLQVKKIADRMQDAKLAELRRHVWDWLTVKLLRKKRISEEQAKKLLEGDDTMFADNIATVLEESQRRKYLSGKTEGKAEDILSILTARFGKAAEKFKDSIYSLNDPQILNSLVVACAVCPSLDDFKAELKKHLS